MRLRNGAAALLALALTGAGSAAPASEETIVFVRHGEKPADGRGQLDCRGLNRALALPAFFVKTFGKIDAVFAPDPGRAKRDGGGTFDYVRPLMTIEPTAVALGLPVVAHIGFDDVAGLQSALEAPPYRDATVVVAWEHMVIADVVRALLAAHGGDPAAVPNWSGDDFDSVYVIRLASGGPARFQRLSEGLDGQPETCPR